MPQLNLDLRPSHFIACQEKEQVLSVARDNVRVDCHNVYFLDCWLRVSHSIMGSVTSHGFGTALGKAVENNCWVTQ